MKKKKKNNKNFDQKQSSFYFEDYLETNKKNKFSQKNNPFQDRIYLLFFLFFSLILIFSIRIIHISLNKIQIFNYETTNQKYTRQSDFLDLFLSKLEEIILNLSVSGNKNF